ncbi:hypothetical protein K456DRAFT_1249940 [Colletotrichum gloeosporioides 23]|nr:hypothetical protein K456DRAFT_1249940 [Colletotrichum gloeosporioides 23]
MQCTTAREDGRDENEGRKGSEGITGRRKDGGNRMFAMGKGVAPIFVYCNAVRTHIMTRRIQKENSIIQDLLSKAFCTFAPFQIIRECLITARTVSTTIAKRREIQKGSSHYGTLSTALRLQDVTLGSDIHAKGAQSVPNYRCQSCIVTADGQTLVRPPPPPRLSSLPYLPSLWLRTEHAWETCIRCTHSIPHQPNKSRLPPPLPPT